jgi:type II secretory pathway predicted ATPase ExeA
MSDAVSIAEFFSWRHHPFADTYPLSEPFLSADDKRFLQRGLSLLSYGKSFALTGPSGSGKSTVVQHILSRLDAHHYKPILIPYGGLRRSGLLRAVASILGVDAASRSFPLLVKLQNHIIELCCENNGRHPVFVIDDAQLLERDSLLDLCSLMANPQKKTIASSLILIGDDSLATALTLKSMSPIRTRLTAIFPMDPLTEQDSRDFIAFRLRHAKAPEHIFEREAITLIASHCHGNRRQIMNLATLLLDEAFLRQEKTISPQLFLSCDLIDISG